MEQNTLHNHTARKLRGVLGVLCVSFVCGGLFLSGSLVVRGGLLAVGCVLSIGCSLGVTRTGGTSGSGSTSGSRGGRDVFVGGLVEGLTLNLGNSQFEVGGSSGAVGAGQSTSTPRAGTVDLFDVGQFSEGVLVT